jgi:hypothetical protein
VPVGLCYVAGLALAGERHDDVVLDILAKNAVSVDCETVRVRLDHGNRSATLRVHISPVLVSLRVQDVVLEIDAILGKNGNDALSTVGKVDLELEACALGRGDVVWDVLGDGVVEFDVPGGIGELRSICVEFEDICAGRCLVVVEVGLGFCSVSTVNEPNKYGITAV